MQNQMFAGMTAWFSSSVSGIKKRLWFDYGGSEASLEEAQFVFSEDATSHDTQRIFESDAYLDEHLAVFHANYIKECIKQKDVKKGVLGKYFLPPVEVQEIARKQMQYHWDFDGHTSDGNSTHSDSGDETGPPPTRDKQKPLQSNTQTTKHTVAHLQPSTSDHHYRRNTVTDTRTAGENINKSVTLSVENKSPGKGTSKDGLKRKHSDDKESKSEKIHQNGKSPRKKQTQDVSNYNNGETQSQTIKNTQQKGKDRNNQVEITDTSKGCKNDQEIQEYLRLEDLAKVAGELNDFIVGQNGCELVAISSHS